MSSTFSSPSSAASNRQVTAEEPRRGEWFMAYLGGKNANHRSISVEIAPATGGSDVTVRSVCPKGPRPTGIRKLLTPLMRLLARPFVRFVVWTQALSLTNGISRALR